MDSTPPSTATPRAWARRTPPPEYRGKPGNQRPDSQFPLFPNSPITNPPKGASAKRPLLPPPVPDLADDQVVLRPAVDRVDDAELLRQLSRLAELADDLSVQLDLVDLAVVHALGIVRVGAVEILRRAA